MKRTEVIWEVIARIEKLKSLRPHEITVRYEFSVLRSSNDCFVSNSSRYQAKS